MEQLLKLRNILQYIKLLDGALLSKSSVRGINSECENLLFKFIGEISSWSRKEICIYNL